MNEPDEPVRETVVPEVDTATEEAVEPDPGPLAAAGDGLTLRLHRMELAGFKSFSDRTEIQFRDGITAVVGPNGCGKSNIGDAINWVLGAQSPKLLRGNSMQDVIFNGSEARKPMGMAEVSLHLVAARGALPDGRREVVLTRRLFRDGESEYLLNGVRARLKDIQEILRQAHVGARTYATIEQGQIDQILNSKPRERRLIIEDAAGVSGFKHKRRLAELRLEATRANLLRVSDIIAEVRRQIGSLRRQAAKARRYQRLREELRAKKQLRFSRLARELDGELARRRDEESGARMAEAEAAARLAELEAEIAAERQALDEAEREFRDTARRFHQLEVEVDRNEERIQHCDERITESRASFERLEEEATGLDARRAALREESAVLEAEAAAERRAVDEATGRLGSQQAAFEEAGRRVEELRGRLEEIRRGLFDSMNQAAERRNGRRSLAEALERSGLQRGRLEEEGEEVRDELTRLGDEQRARALEVEAAAAQLARLEGEHDTAERALREARERHGSDLERLAAAREREKSASARLRTLEDVATRFAGVSDGVRLLLTTGASAGVRTAGVLADYVDAGRQLEGAAEVYLQGILPAVVLEDDADTARAAELLRTQGAGRTSLISRTHPAGAPAVGGAPNGRPPFPEQLRRDPRVLGRFRDHVTLKTAANGFVQDRIGDAIVVDSLETALALHRAHPHEDYLTPAGDVVYASGVVAAGGAGNGSDRGLLVHNRKTRETRSELAEASAEAASLGRRVEDAKAEIARLEEQSGARRQALEEARRRRLEAEMRAQRAGEEGERARRRSEIFEDERAALDDEARRLEAELAAADLEVEEAERAHREAEARLAAASADLEGAEAGFRSAAEEVAAAREDLAVRRQRRENAESRLGQAGEAMTDLTARIERARGDAAASDRRASEARDLKARTEQDLAGHLQERERHAAEVARGEQVLGERRARLAQQEDGLRARRSELEACRQSTGAAELARARAEADRQHLDDLCHQELGIPAGEAGQDVEPTELDVETLESEIADLLDRIEKVGPVNMTAIEEFSGLEERHAFLSAQRKDLEESMESLRETIRRINRSSRERFQEAFDAIRRNYQEIYRTLFNGGRADLRLEEGEDVLECGIEIMSQPPGKRLGNVSLLSGGEKAMSAIALLFAIFRYQPSPFCLLDEVDAALDDVNVGRFNRMLREYAHENQFVIVTHNKLSMESANTLYGVTMEQPGVSKLISLQLG